MSKRPLEAAKGHFKVDHKQLPKVLKKAVGTEIDIWFKFGTIGCGSVRTLIDEKYQYTIRTEGWAGPGMWTSTILAIEKL